MRKDIMYLLELILIEYVKVIQYKIFIMFNILIFSFIIIIHTSLYLTLIVKL